MTEVLVRVVTPRRAYPGDESADGAAGPDDETPCFYDALIYCESEMPGVGSAPPLLSSDGELAGLPLRGAEKVGVRWRLYRRYLTSFINGEAHAAGDNAEAIFAEPPEALRKLLAEGVAGHPTRVWWGCDSSELDDLPWELLAPGRQNTAGAVSFVRGLPTDESPPKVPVWGKLNLAFIHDPRHTPPSLIKALEELSKGDQPPLKVVSMYEPPRKALARAVSEGFELIHLVTDGTVTSGREGVLHFSKTAFDPSLIASTIGSVSPFARRFFRFVVGWSLALRRVLPDSIVYRLNDQLYKKLDIETFSPRELSTMLCGSRVAVVSFSAPATAGRAPDRFDGLLLPKVYSAFVSFGGAPLPLPNVVAPVGAMTDEQAKEFWKMFYARLSEPDCYSTEEAAEAARAAAPHAPLALFLRQCAGRDFEPQTSARTAEERGPRRVYAELQAAEDFLRQIQSVDKKYERVLGEQFTESSSYKEAEEYRESLKIELNSWEPPGKEEAGRE